MLLLTGFATHQVSVNNSPPIKSYDNFFAEKFSIWLVSFFRCKIRVKMLGT